MNRIFLPRTLQYNLQTACFFGNYVSSSKYGLNLLKIFASEIWQMIPIEIKN